MSFKVLQEDRAARIGELKTRHGKVRTPTVFPVHNLGAQGGWNTPRYWDVFPNIRTAMFNACYIFRNNRKIHDRIKQAGGIHSFLEFEGVAFADSGGYLGLDTPLKMSQETVIAIQESIGADIASTLDFPFNMRESARVHRRICRSVENAKQACKEKSGSGMLLYASVHGDDPLVLRNVLRFLSKDDGFDGYAVGSLVPIRSSFRSVIDFVIAARSAIPDKPLHVFGLGGFLTVLLLAYLGVDSCDSTAFIICAGKRLYFVPGYREFEMEELSKLGELPCSCPICCSRSVETMRLDRSLIALHNLWAVWHEIKQVRFAIAAGCLEKYLEKRFSKAPTVRLAFEYAKRRLKHMI